jgi:hypothetical protein
MAGDECPGRSTSQRRQADRLLFDQQGPKGRVILAIFESQCGHRAVPSNYPQLRVGRWTAGHRRQSNLPIELLLDLLQYPQLLARNQTPPRPPLQEFHLVQKAGHPGCQRKRKKCMQGGKSRNKAQESSTAHSLEKALCEYHVGKIFE